VYEVCQYIFAIVDWRTVRVRVLAGEVGFVFLVFVGRGGIVISDCCGERGEHQIAVAEHGPNCGTLATVMIAEDESQLCILSSTY
jgi:hypothetical protein